MRLLGPSDFRRMPWKNGAGSTTQIAIAPFDATVDDFDWRVSTAQVAASGTFSTFAGVDRTLAILRGGPLKLVVQSPDGPQQHVLDVGSAPYRFAGEWPVQADVLGADEAVDFNVMTRRDRFDHVLQTKDICGVMRVAGAILLVYCVHGAVKCRNATDRLCSPLSLVGGEALLALARPGVPDSVHLQLETAISAPARICVVNLFKTVATHA